MAVVIVSSIVFAVVLLFQGIYILRNGNMRPFFLEPGDLGSGPSLTPRSKYVAGCFYVIAGAMIFCLLTIALFKNGTDRFSLWFTSHFGGVLGVLFIVASGLLSFLRPDVVLRWVTSAYSDYDLDDKSSRFIVRGIGVCLVAIGLYGLTRL